MNGLSILKDQPDPVALPDDQYPDWLWTLLDEPVSASSGGMEGKLPGDLKSGADFRQEKKRLRSV
jgi:large subunit ribosomal protein L54